MNDHPYLDVIKRYLRGCNTGDIDLMMSTFTEDIKVYLTQSEPVYGRKKAAYFFKELHDQVNGRWTIDHVLVQGNEVVIEWSAKWYILTRNNQEMFERGVEWYVFKGDQIAEIRAYGDSRNRNPLDQIYELNNFPYKERGYTLSDDFEAHLP